MTITSSGLRSIQGPRGPALRSITFTQSGTGAATTETDLFTVTGAVLVIYTAAYVRTNLDQSAGTPTLSYGITNTVAHWIAATTATLLDAGEIWIDNTPIADKVAIPSGLTDMIIEENISCTVGGSNHISAGVIDFSVLWIPVSTNGNLVAT